jgi:hypothetical protein
MIDHQTALIYTMVMVSAADRDMTDAELQTIGDIVKRPPRTAPSCWPTRTASTRRWP